MRTSVTEYGSSVWRQTMKVTKYALVTGAALCAVSAHAQFGAVSKADLEVSGNKQGVYLSYSPFARLSANGGGSASGYIISGEKAISEGKFGPNVLGGFFGSFNSNSIYAVTYRFYVENDASIGFGILGGDGFGGKNDFSAMYYKDLGAVGKSKPDLTLQVGAGLLYDAASSNVNLSAVVRASYPIQSGFSLDASFWYLHLGGNSGNFFTLGIGYRM